MDNPSINGWLFGVPPWLWKPPHQSLAGTTLCAPGQNGQWDIQWSVLIQQIWNLDYITTDNICIYYGVFFSLWLAIYTVRGFPMARPKGKFLQRHLAVDHPRCGTNLDTIADWLRVDQASRDGRLTRRTCVNLHHKWNPGASAKRASKQYIFQYMYAYRGRKWVS